MHQRLFTFILVLFFILTHQIQACQCPMTALTKPECDKYDLIFRGSISNVQFNEGKSFVMFRIKDLYKGISTETFKVFFDEADPCRLDMRVGDEWIIYTNYYQMNNAKMDFCSRSRKFFKNMKEDFVYSTSNVSYDEEVKFLQNNYGLHTFLKENQNKVENRNQLPDKKQFVIYLLISLLGIILFYYLFNRFFK